MNFRNKGKYRLLAICLCVMLTTVMLTACGGGGSSDTAKDTTAKKTEQTKDAKDKKSEKKKDKEKKDSEKAAKKTTSKKASKSSDKTASKDSSSSKEKSSKEGSSQQGSKEGSKKNPSSKPAESAKCTISVSASKILSSSKASEDTKALAGNGTLLSSTSVEIQSGDTVKLITKRICQDKGLTLAFGDSGYISGIGGIYEFDAGQKSGWMYSVNGEFPSKGCDEYVVKKGDVISWKYTLNLGKDL